MNEHQQFPPHNTQQPPSGHDVMELFAQGLAFVVRAWACSIYIFTRRNFGRRYYSASFFAALPLIGFFGVIASTGQTSMVLYSILLYVSLALMIYHKLRQIFKRSDVEPHSDYDGRPRICDWFSISESSAKSFWEGFSVSLLGGLLMLLSPGLGAYFVVGGVACMLDYQRNIEGVREKVQRLRDSEIEQDLIRREYERMYGDRR